MKEEELIKQTAEKYGFNLEFKTSRILEECGYTPELNRIIIHNDKPIEIDVIATKNIPELHLIIECKGANKDSVLILVQTSTNRLDENIRTQGQGDNSDSRYTIDDSEYKMPTFNINGECSPIYTVIGDFFQKKNEKTLKKASKNDENNNFYKAQEQIIEAIAAYSTQPVYNPENDDRYDYIIPLIVTNAEIWAVDFNNKETIVSKHKWVLHRILNNTNKLRCKLRSDSKYCSYFSIPVININYLKSALDPMENISPSSSATRLELSSGLIRDDN